MATTTNTNSDGNEIGGCAVNSNDSTQQSGHGNGIVTMLVARLDTRKYLLAGKRVETIRWADQLYEILETDVINLAKSRGYTANSSRNLGGILDLTGYNLSQHACLACLQVYVEWIQHMEFYYPEGVNHLILVNLILVGPSKSRVLLEM